MNTIDVIWTYADNGQTFWTTAELTDLQRDRVDEFLALATERGLIYDAETFIPEPCEPAFFPELADEVIRALQLEESNAEDRSLIKILKEVSV